MFKWLFNLLDDTEDSLKLELVKVETELNCIISLLRNAESIPGYYLDKITELTVKKATLRHKLENFQHD